MSRMFFTERGRILISENEEITRWRWAKKRLTLPKAVVGRPADLWLFVNMYDGNCEPLHVQVNGKAVAAIEPDEKLARNWAWRRVPIRTRTLKAGVNEIILSSGNAAMSAWMLGLESGHRDPQSFLSTDRGATWQHDHMGAHGTLRGEYAVRLRVHDLPDLPSPPITYESASHPRVKELLELVPASIRQTREPWQQLRRLRTWIARSWAHDPAPQSSYAPWDPWTVLDWTKREWGHGRSGKIAMCVHFGAVFSAFATALGHRARCVAVATDFHEPYGHFMAEAWDERLGKWILHDPNLDIHYENGMPLSALELANYAQRKQTLKNFVRAGDGMPKGPPHLIREFEKYFATGKSFRITGLWSRNDFVSKPHVAPPNHGTITYCETDFVWYTPGGQPLAEMFPYAVSDPSYFSAPPEGSPRRVSASSIEAADGAKRKRSKRPRRS